MGSRLDISSRSFTAAILRSSNSLCREAVARQGYTIAGVFSDQEISGANNHRPGYQRLLAAARERAFDAIVVEAQDRLWRDQAEMHAAIARLRYLGIKVFSVATGSDLTDYGGRVVATVLGLKDEIFLEDLRAKTHRGYGWCRSPGIQSRRPGVRLPVRASP